MGKAIHTREMIQDGDHVMVAVSGGKDSMSLLWLLRERIKRIPIDYKITAVHVVVLSHDEGVVVLVFVHVDFIQCRDAGRFATLQDLRDESVGDELHSSGLILCRSVR